MFLVHYLKLILKKETQNGTIGTASAPAHPWMRSAASSIYSAKIRFFRPTAVESSKIPNMIFYGPSGVGKTTVASIIAAGSGMPLHKLSGTTASTSDIKSVLADIGTLGASGGITFYILTRYNILTSASSRGLLECVEQGTVTLIASTTENPYFYVYNALLSRCTVFEFKSLTTDDIRTGLRSAAAPRGRGQVSRAHSRRRAGIPGPECGRRYAQGAGQSGICRHRCTCRKRQPHDRTEHGAAGRRAHGHAV